MAEETHNPLASKSGDSSKKKKRREQVIVLGTILLVVLTFVLVIRHGSSAQPASADDTAGGVTPDTSGDSGADTNDALPGEIGNIPGQVQALQQPAFTNLENQLRNVRKQLATVRKQNRKEIAKENKLETQLQHLKAPRHKIKVVHHGTGKHPKQHNELPSWHTTPHI